MSLRTVYSALGLTGTVSLCRDVLGFTQGFPSRLSTARPEAILSVGDFVHGLRRVHFHVRLIVAGADLLTPAEEKVIDYAVFRFRQIYRSSGLGVGRVTRDPRNVATSQGHATVTTLAEVASTGHDLTADGDFVPVVLPASMSVTTTGSDGTVSITLGLSPVPGPCSPRNRPGMNSSVVDIAGEGTGRTLAHEIGHYLGANHPATPGNDLMTQTGSVVGDAFVAVTIVPDDLTTMRAHCSMHDAIPV